LAQKLAHATFNYLRALDPIASPKDFGPGDRFVLPEEWIASQVHFDRLQIADEAFFIGFPGFDGRMWFEEAAVLPIARTASLASIPSVPFTNTHIRTADVLMVAGLSFSGSSGSIVINRRQGIPPGGDRLSSARSFTRHRCDVGSLQRAGA